MNVVVVVALIHGIWTPPVSLDGCEGINRPHGSNHDLLDNLEDIFTLSGSSSNSTTPGSRLESRLEIGTSRLDIGTSSLEIGTIPSNSETNEFNLVQTENTDLEFDEESLYSDALSRKASLVRILACMSFLVIKIYKHTQNFKVTMGVSYIILSHKIYYFDNI